MVVAGREVPGFAASAPFSGRSVRLGGRPALVGWVRGVAPSSEGELELGYAIVDLGKEKVVARYFGPVGHVAFNRATFNGSLQSLEADPLLTDEVAAPLPAMLEPATLGPAPAPLVFIPRGWYREPADAALPRPSAPDAASPPRRGDFTVSFRAAWWRAHRGGDPSKALAACGRRTSAAIRLVWIRQSSGRDALDHGSFVGHAAGCGSSRWTPGLQKARCATCSRHGLPHDGQTTDEIELA